MNEDTTNTPTATATATAATASTTAATTAESNSPLVCIEKALTLLPLEEKLCFMQAVRVAPAVVSQESEPIRFWTAAGGNALQAAQNLCRYWKERFVALGGDGDGDGDANHHRSNTNASNTNATAPLAAVLQASDVNALQHGRPVSILAEDAQGASVLYYDKTLACNRGLLSVPQLLQPAATTTTTTTNNNNNNNNNNIEWRDSTTTEENQRQHAVATAPSYFAPATRARLLFAACQTVAFNTVSQTDGCVFILRVNPTESQQALRFHKSHLELGKYLAHIFPIRIKAWHVVALFAPPPRANGDSTISNSQDNNSTQWIQQTLPVLLARWEALLGKPAVIHAGTDPHTILTSLRQHGILLDALPPSDADEKKEDTATTTSTIMMRRPKAYLTASEASAVAALGTSSARGTAANTATATATTTAATQKPTVMDLSGRANTSPPASLPPARVAAALASVLQPYTSPSSSARSTTALLGDWQRKTLQHAEDAGVLDDPRIRQSGLQQLADAVGFLPDHQKEAYLQAQRKCPALVQAESDPLKFLRFHRYNAWSAAQRITTYWNKRKAIFGKRWLLPMTMTGDGAMNQEDITFARSGYFYFLPDDKDGRTVICYDPSRRVDHEQETRLRIGFYFWSIICENDACVRDGYVAIVLLGNHNFGVASLDGTIREKVDMVMDCFPTAPKNTHLVQTITGPTTRRSLLEMLLPLIFSLMGRLLENSGVQHVSESRGEMAKEFEAFGLSASGLPESAGGTWSFDEFYQWQLERYRSERSRYGKEHYRAAASLASVSPVAETLTTSTFRPQVSLSSFFLSPPLQSHQQDMDQIDSLVRRLVQPDKAAYLEACQKVPNLVRDESRPAWFRVHAKGDLRTAARQLAAYWTLRKRLFGEKAFLPMAQTGEGGLGRKDLILLSSSFITVLPTKSTETIILSYDCAKDDLSDEMGRLRVAFYILSLTAERDMSRSKGFSIVASGLNELAKLRDDGSIPNDTSFQSLLDVFPFRVAAVHITMLLQPGKTCYPLDSTVQAMRRLFGYAGTFQGLVHVGTSRDEIAEQLATYGIDKAILPRSLGGGFGYDRFTQWQELRIRYEWGLPAGANDRDALEIYDFSKVVPLPDLSEEERKERKRRMNVVHSRRKRERERIEIEVLQEQCDDLRDKRVVLTEESYRLEGFLRHAQSLVCTVSSAAEVGKAEEDSKQAALPNGGH